MIRELILKHYCRSMNMNKIINFGAPQNCEALCTMSMDIWLHTYTNHSPMKIDCEFCCLIKIHGSRVEFVFCL